MKIPKKIELQRTAMNHSSITIYNKFTDEPHSFLVNDTTLASDNPLRFRKNIFNI